MNWALGKHMGAMCVFHTDGEAMWVEILWVSNKSLDKLMRKKNSQNLFMILNKQDKPPWRIEQ